MAARIPSAFPYSPCQVSEELDTINLRQFYAVGDFIFCTVTSSEASGACAHGAVRLVAPDISPSNKRDSEEVGPHTHIPPTLTHMFLIAVHFRSLM